MHVTILFAFVLDMLRKVSGSRGCGEAFVYTGNLTVTDGGRMCQHWQNKTPHYHNFDDEEFGQDYYFYSDGSIEDAKNYCRNTGSDAYPWCYTTDPDVRSEYCSIRLCAVPDQACRNRTNLAEYSGDVSVTDGSRTCQKWSEQTPHAHPYTSDELFPLDGSIEDASNYCRNIGGDSLPWCYTNDVRVRWQYCHEQICQVNEPQCGGILTNASGWLATIDRDADGQYDDYRDCLWTIIAPEDSIIQINFLMIDGMDCDRHSFVELYDDDQDYVFCKMTTTPFRSNSSILHVRMHTSSAQEGKGVNLTFYHVDRSLETTTLLSLSGTEEVTKPTNSSPQVVLSFMIHLSLTSMLVIGSCV